MLLYSPRGYDFFDKNFGKFIGRFIRVNVFYSQRDCNWVAVIFSGIYAQNA